MSENLKIKKKVEEFTAKFDNNSENWKNQIHIFMEEDGSAVVANCKGMGLVIGLLTLISTMLTENQKDGEIGEFFKQASQYLSNKIKETNEKHEEYLIEKEKLNKVLGKLSPNKVTEMSFSELLKEVAKGMEEENKKSKK